jgi:hypothetical protein
VSLSLPDRSGPRPRTSEGIPHQQLDQIPSSEVYEAFVARFTRLPGTETGPSLVSVPGARALFLSECDGCNARSGFMRGREMAHVHPPSDGSMHVVLAPDDCATVLARGWGELHPYALSGRVLPTLAMVYAPRDEAEVDIALRIAGAALANARGAP